MMQQDHKHWVGPKISEHFQSFKKENYENASELPALKVLNVIKINNIMR